VRRALRRDWRTQRGKQWHLRGGIRWGMARRTHKQRRRQWMWRILGKTVRL
jgi:hypothetical protein